MMRSVLKSGTGAVARAVRPLGFVQEISLQEQEHERLRGEIVRLQAELRAATASLMQEESRTAESYEAGRASGQAEGLSLAAQDDARRLELLQNTIEAALQQLRAQMAIVEEAGSLLARDCLEILFGETTSWDAALKQVLKLQLSKLDAALVLGIELSRSDFPDATALANIAIHNGLRPGKVVAREDFAPGSCIIRLRLGEIDVGIPQQWSILRKTLEQIGTGEAGA